MLQWMNTYLEREKWIAKIKIVVNKISTKNKDEMLTLVLIYIQSTRKSGNNGS